MNNEFELTEIKNFPLTDSLTGAGQEIFPVSKNDGRTYGIKSSDLKAFLGTVQSTPPRPILPTDPVPSLDGVYLPEIDGLYPNAGGLVRDTSIGGVDEGLAVQFLKNGLDWVKFTYPLPKPFKGVPVWEKMSYKKGDQVLHYGQYYEASGLTTPDDVPDVSELWDIAIYKGVYTDSYDRPDLVDEGFFVDNGGNVIQRIGGDFILSKDFDRPDKPLVYVDNNGFIILDVTTVGGGGDTPDEKVAEIARDEIRVSEFIELFTDFGSKQSMDVDPGIPLSELYGLWDGILSRKINNPNYPNYVSKTLLGKSTNYNQDIWRYDFKPPTPKVKMILVGCTHGWEKNPTYMLQQFFDYFVDNWAKHPMTQWARWNVHFIVVPVLNAGGYIPSPFPDSPDSRGQRRVLETLPFPASWTKTGNEVTITFNTADFPDTNGRLDAATYFSHEGVAGKVYVTVTDTNDSVSLPKGGYRIESVVNGTTIKIAVDSGGSSSGSCEICVSTDPNRQYPCNNPTWESYTSIGAVNGYPPSAQDNKGTKPFSINESIIMRDLLISEDDETLTCLLDLHAGAGDYVTLFNNASGMSLRPVEEVMKLASDFTATPMELRGTPRNPLSAYASQIHNMAGYTPEWSWASTLSAENATEQYRWFANLILILARLYNKKTN